MSIKVGNQIIAGNVAVKMQDRIFIARRSFENGQEYYDIEVPKGCSLGFTQATKIALIIVGTNTTTSPKLRYQTTILDIVGGNFNRDLPIKLGSLVDGLLSEMYMGTSSTKIYLASNRNNYIELENTPILQDDDGEETPIIGGVNTYESLHLPYLKDNKLIMNKKDFLKINPDGFAYGNLNYKDEHKFLSERRLVWEKSANESYQLATVKDIEDLAIADKFVSVLTYSRNRFEDLERISDAEIGDFALILESSIIYVKTKDSWNLHQKLNYDDSNNGWYYEIEDVDGTLSGKAVWNTTNGGQFDLFVNYTNSIDNYTLGRNSNRALQVNKLLNSLTIKVPKENKEVVFDGSEDKVLQIDIDLSNYYTIPEIDSYYNDNEESSIAAFYKDGDNIKIKGLDIKEENLVTKKEGSFLTFGNTPVDASLIKYTKEGLYGESVADFLNGNFAYIDKENNFSTTQKIEGQLIATQNWVEGWAQGTLLPNTFNLDLLTSLNLELNSPTLGKTSLRYQGINLSTGKTTTKDIELPVVSNDNNGLVTPSQKTLWDTVTSKTPLTLTEGNIVSTISYEDGTPKLMTNSPTQFAGVDVRYNEEDILQLKLLASQEGSGLYSGMISDKTGAYVYQNEALTLDDYHKVVNQGYVQDNSVMQNTIQPDENWSNDRVILNDLTFVNITASGASLQQKGSSLSTKGSVTTLKAFPIVNSTKAGLATAAMFNQIEANRNAIAGIQGQGSVGAYLGQGPTQEDLQNAWDNGKPGTAAMEGANVINLDTGNTWRYMYVEGNLQWVNLGVLGGNGIATTLNTGLVKSSEDTPGMIQVESDGTMSLIGWDSLNTDIQNLDLDLGNLEQSLNTHTTDMGNGNTTPHVTLSDRNNWNSGVSTANNAIPKVSSAVNNNLVLWSTNGVLKDSGKAFVTDFTTPTDNGIPSALAVQNAITSAVQAETTARTEAITAINTNITNLNTSLTSNYLPLSAGSTKKLTGALLSSENIILDNTKGFQIRNTSGTAIDMVRFNASNQIIMGTSSTKYDIVSYCNIRPSTAGADLGSSDKLWTNIYGTNIYQNSNKVLDISGGTMTGPLVFNDGDGTTRGNIQLLANGQITDGSTATLFGRVSTSANNLIVGHGNYIMQLRGKNGRPTYNGYELALKDDVGDVDLSAYVTSALALREFGMLVPRGTSVPSNANLNSTTYLKVGNYYCSADVTVATLTNCPTSSAFMMQVLSPLSTTYDNESGAWVYRVRILTTYTGKVYYQNCSTNGSGTWSYGAWRNMLNSGGGVIDSGCTLTINGTLVI